MARARRPATPPALSAEQVAELRAAVARGERPRVVARTASSAVPAGSRGVVVRIGDPSDPEFIVVRIKGDDIPFGPAELAATGRAARTPRATPAPARAPTPAPPPAAKPRKAAARGKLRNPRTLPAMAVTFRFAGGSWTVEAVRGGRKLGRAQPARAGAVRAVADAIDHEQVANLVRETVEACRSVVADRAENLRAELAAAEAALREYDG